MKVIRYNGVSHERTIRQEDFLAAGVVHHGDLTIVKSVDAKATVSNAVAKWLLSVDPEFSLADDLGETDEEMVAAHEAEEAKRQADAELAAASMTDEQRAMQEGPDSDAAAARAFADPASNPDGASGNEGEETEPAATAKKGKKST